MAISHLADLTPRVTPAQQHHAPLTRDGGCEAARLSVNVPSQRRQDKKCGIWSVTISCCRRAWKPYRAPTLNSAISPTDPPNHVPSSTFSPLQPGHHQGAFSNSILLDHLITLRNRSHGAYPLGPRSQLTRYLHFLQTSATLISNAANVSKTNPRSHHFVVVAVYSYTE